jgi:hypothetical protein
MQAAMAAFPARAFQSVTASADAVLGDTSIRPDAIQRVPSLKIVALVDDMLRLGIDNSLRERTIRLPVPNGRKGRETGSRQLKE